MGELRGHKKEVAEPRPAVGREEAALGRAEVSSRVWIALGAQVWVYACPGSPCWAVGSTGYAPNVPLTRLLALGLWSWSDSTHPRKPLPVGAPG